jgi:hypothetical protein
MLAKQGRSEAVTLADAFCIEARQRIRAHFRALFGPSDPTLYRVAMQVLRGEHAWLEQGIVGLVPAGDATEAATLEMPVPAKADDDARMAGTGADRG